MVNKIKNELSNYVLMLIGTIILAMSFKFFVYPANLVPSGFTGVAILIQRIVESKLAISIPLTLINVLLNLIPAIFAFKVIGKYFTAVSFVIMFTFTFITDMLPSLVLTNDIMVNAIFGGILGGLAFAIFFRCGVSSGGTDFISQTISTLYHKDIFNYILAFNVLIILVQAVLFGVEIALYSIIYQYICTSVLKLLYRHYEASTIIVITEKPDLISTALNEKTKHSVTILKGTGSYTKTDKYFLYIIVSSPEVKLVLSLIKNVDNKAFINILKSHEIQGNFSYLPVDTSEILFNSFL